MGGGNGQSTTPKPPPTPKVTYDPATSAAEAALADATKQSYASSVETEDQKAKNADLGKAPVNASASAAQPSARRKPNSGATTMNLGSSGGMAQSAVLTG